MSTGARRVPAEQRAAWPAAAEGLSAAEIEQRRGHGSNDIVPPTASGWASVVRASARDPMLWFLVLTAGLFGLLGQTSEALTLLVAAVPLLGMDAWLHRRTAASAAGLAARLASRARVLRGGQWQEIPARELLPGDLAAVAPGEYFPADGLLVSGSGLQADESTLTGESLPVAKRALDTAVPGPHGVPDEHWGTAGTRLLTGRAQLRVVFTGGDTRYGEIVRSATEGGHAATPLQQAIKELVVVLIGVALALCLMLAAIRLWHGHGWIDALLSAATLAVAALPEEFPVVYTFFLGAGAFRLARRQALVRRAVAVENIGRVSCIVTDKTGTITTGTLVLAHHTPADGFDEAALLRVAAWASRPDSGDPLDEALHGAAQALPASTRLADFPFTEARRRETRVLRVPGEGTLACTKGAPETVLAQCALPPDAQAAWLARTAAYAGSGHKVIACARRRLVDSADPAAEPEGGFELAGLLAFEDPVRAGVREAMADCRAAGLRVIMVTGDHPATAEAIAREIGLGGSQPVVVTLAPEDDGGAVVRQQPAVHVVARATPAQKLALVQALQAQRELVAVTGDGVNDVPALRLADIGVAMGERGTRSAREVAAVVLLDDNFRTIVAAMAEGRQLLRNLRLAFAYLLLVHLPLVVGAAAIPLLDLPPLFLPVHIVWLELVIHPTAMLAFQAAPAAGPLAAQQQERRTRFFSPSAWQAIALAGTLASVAVVWSYLYALGDAREVEHARTLALGMLVAASAGFTSGLTRLRHPAARWLVAGTLTSLAAILQVPLLSRLLHLGPLHGADAALVVAAFAGAVLLALTVASRVQGHAQGHAQGS